MCGGSGRLPLPEEFAETLAALRRAGISAAADLCDLMGVSHSSMCNRLARLYREGLVTRRKVGKEWLYAAKVAA